MLFFGDLLSQAIGSFILMHFCDLSMFDALTLATLGTIGFHVRELRTTKN